MERRLVLAFLLNVIKPPGLTSQDVLSKLKRVLPIKKLGHSGTLDPAACGVLPVFVGEATKFINWQKNEEKEYRAEIIWGIKTDSGDYTGNVIAREKIDINDKQIVKVLEQFIGESSQLPPMYSAVQINGKRLYELARAGQIVERQPRPIYISQLELLAHDAERAFIRVVCSRGTYVRTLCEDIGERVGISATMGFLLRVRSGMFYLQQAERLDAIMADYRSFCLPIDQLWPDARQIFLSERQYSRLKGGHWFSWRGESLVCDTMLRIYKHNGDFCGLVRYVESDEMQRIIPIKVI